MVSYQAEVAWLLVRPALVFDLAFLIDFSRVRQRLVRGFRRAILQLLVCLLPIVGQQWNNLTATDDSLKTELHVCRLSDFQDRTLQRGSLQERRGRRIPDKMLDLELVTRLRWVEDKSLQPADGWLNVEETWWESLQQLAFCYNGLEM